MEQIIMFLIVIISVIAGYCLRWIGEKNININEVFIHAKEEEEAILPEE